MKLRKILLVLLACSLLLTLSLLGTVVAYMFKQTDSVANDLMPAYVDCEVVETFDGSTKSSITVKNTSNIDAYLRVRLVTYWVNDNGEIMPKASESITVDLAEGWIKGSGNTYYYTSPVKPEASTPDLLKDNAVLALARDESTGYRQVVEVFAEAIQSKPASAVTSSWGVTLTDGKITAAP